MINHSAYAEVIVSVVMAVDVSDFIDEEIRCIPMKECIADDFKVPKSEPKFGHYGMNKNREIFTYRDKWYKI